MGNAFVPLSIYDDVLGWRTPDEIDALITEIQEDSKKFLDKKHEEKKAEREARHEQKRLERIRKHKEKKAAAEKEGTCRR